MRSIHQHGTDYISIPRKSDDSDCGSVIYKSKSVRTTERDALSSPNIPSHDLDLVVRELRPSEHHRWCSGCNHWIRFEGFGKDADSSDGYDHYCRDCRKDQQRRWSLTRAYDRLFPKGLTGKKRES